MYEVSKSSYCIQVDDSLRVNAPSAKKGFDISELSKSIENIMYPGKDERLVNVVPGHVLPNNQTRYGTPNETLLSANKTTNAPRSVTFSRVLIL